MSTFYHASPLKNFSIERKKRSRYGFSALFFSNNIELVQLYFKEHKGSIIEIHDPIIYHEVDFQNKISYCGAFKSLIIQLQRAGHKSVLIKNVIDFPSQKNKVYQSSNILVFFDLSEIPPFYYLL